VQEVGARLAAGLCDLAGKHGVIREVRGAGLMWGLDLHVDAAPFVQAALRRRVLINRTADTVLRCFRRLSSPRRRSIRPLRSWTRSSPRASRSVPHDDRTVLLPIIVPGSAVPVAHEPGAGPAVRQATGADAPAIHQLIVENLQSGHLLPRSLTDVTARASRFTVVVGGSGVAWPAANWRL